MVTIYRVTIPLPSREDRRIQINAKTNRLQ